MIDSYGILFVHCTASSGFPPYSRVCCGGFFPTLFATLDVRLTGLDEDMHPGGFPAFLKGKVMAIFQIGGDLPVEKLRLKMLSSSCLALGPRALRNVGGGGYRLALGRLWRPSGGWPRQGRPFARQHSNLLLQSVISAVGCGSFFFVTP